MASPRDQLTADLKEAMRSGADARKTAIRGVLAALNEAEQRKREDLVKKALKKHNVTRPTGQDDEEAMAAYGKAVDAALAAEKVGENSALDEAEQLAVIQKLIKQRGDSIADAKQAGRDDLVEAEQAERAMLEGYLPQQLSREEVEAEARAVIAEVGAGDPRDMGKVMGPLMNRLQGRADGKLVSEVVRALLAG
jgi:uncharacterized protein YqeY